MKFKTKIGEMETDRIFYNYSEEVATLNSKWFKKDVFAGIGEDGKPYNLHYVDNRELWVAVKV